MSTKTPTLTKADVAEIEAALKAHVEAHEAAKPKAESMIAAARAALILGSKPSTVFFAQLVMQLEPSPVLGIPTAGTDGKVLIYNPTFINSLTPPQVVGLLAHEVLHPAYSHHTRRGARDPKRFNIAADMAINPVVKECGLELPADGCWPEQINEPEGETADYYYRRLEEQQGSKSEDGGGDPSGDGSPQNGGTGEYGDVADPGKCGAVMDATGSKEEQAKTEERWKVEMVRAATLAKQRGDLPASLNKIIDEIVEGTVDWREVLQEFVQSKAKTDYRWSPPNRRFVGSGTYLPGLTGEELGSIIMLSDESGSISDHNVAQFVGEIEAIARLYDINVIILHHDTEVLDEAETWSPMDGPLTLTRKKCGGTSHVQPLKYIDERYGDGSAECIIAFTDGYTTVPDTPPSLPILWAVVGNDNFTPPFGTVVRMADES